MFSAVYTRHPVVRSFRASSIHARRSERRAQAVAAYARSRGVDASRIQSKGYAFDQPIADNSTESGRQQNRRVEVIIVASDEMKEAAENGELDQ